MVLLILVGSLHDSLDMFGSGLQPHLDRLAETWDYHETNLSVDAAHLAADLPATQVHVTIQLILAVERNAFVEPFSLCYFRFHSLFPLCCSETAETCSLSGGVVLRPQNAQKGGLFFILGVGCGKTHAELAFKTEFKNRFMGQKLYPPQTFESLLVLVDSILQVADGVFECVGFVEEIFHIFRQRSGDIR